MAKIPELYIKENKGCNLNKVTESLIISSYVCDGQNQVFKDLYKMSPNLWIFAIGYKKDEKLADVQFLITGSGYHSFGYNELPLYTANYELTEEAGIEAVNIDKFNVKSSIITKKRRVNIFTIRGKHCKPAVKMNERIGISDKKTKVGVVVYGNKNEILKIVGLAELFDETETIGYYLAIPIEYIISCINMKSNIIISPFEEHNNNIEKESEKELASENIEFAPPGLNINVNINIFVNPLRQNNVIKTFLFTSFEK